MKNKSRIKLLKAIHKEAGVLDDATSFIAKGIASIVDMNNPVTSIAQLILEGVIFSKVGWVGAIITTVLDVGFGINVTSLWQKISEHVIPFMTQNQGKSVNVDAASTQLTQQVVSSLGVPVDKQNITADEILQNDPAVKTSLNNMRNEIIKNAGVGSAAAGALGKSSIINIIKAIIKALFIGAGFSAAGNAISSGVKSFTGIGGDPQKTDEKKKEPSLNKNTSILKYVGNPSSSYSQAFVKYKNDAGKADSGGGGTFYLISKGPFNDLIFELVNKIYPDMPEKVKNDFEKNFEQVVSQVKQEFFSWNENIKIEREGTYIRVPSEIGGISLNSLKDIADLTLTLMQIK